MSAIGNNTLATWQVISKTDCKSPVIPDGCRDLICYRSATGRPKWFISSLYDQTCEVTMFRNDIFTGYRLKPGTKIDKAGLLASIDNCSPNEDQILDRLDSFTNLPDRLSEALDCLASGVPDNAVAASQLGVSVRTLQRQIITGTGRTPVYWLQLARVRRAARAVCNNAALADVAHDYGFADQSHMNRQFRRWLALTPATLKTDSDEAAQLHSPGFA